MENRYLEAKRIYAEYGIDTEKALDVLKDVPISVHCWQGDDVLGFDGTDALSGGIQTTGDYPGRARTFEELCADIKKAFALMPGKKRLNLHACYAILGEDAGKIDRDQYTIKHFEPWIKFAKGIGLDGIDFNPTFFAHPKMKDGLSLSSPDEATRKFWIEHAKRCLEISSELGKAFGKPCLMNIWIPDGLKDVPADRLGPRVRLKNSLDEILADYDHDNVIVTVESKVFGIGAESYTVGSNEFYQIYAATHPGVCCLLDNGHYHPTEQVADKIPALLAFYDRVALHVSRPVRWDSDHVVILNDDVKDICTEIVRNDAINKVTIALDFFDASINRLSAWVTGQRSVERALLTALLQPHKELKELQDKAQFTDVMVLMEAAKDLPFGDVWNEYLRRQGLSTRYLEEIKEYEKEVLSLRK